MFTHRFIGNIHRLSAAAIIFSLAGQANADVCYVNASAATPGDGTSSWANAATFLQPILAKRACTEVWIAKGVYKPELPAANPSNSFDIQPGTAVYGGFAGDETDRDSRNPTANLTILSGDIDDNDAHVDGDQIDRTFADIVGNNSYHVVVMDGTVGDPIGASTVLDGFTITGGDASSNTDVDESGGGLYCTGKGAGHACSPTLANINFFGNYGYSGGAVYSEGGDAGASNPNFINAVFVGNGSVPSDGGSGGAMLAFAFNNGTVSPTFSNVLFRENEAGAGGAIYVLNDSGTSKPLFSNVTFAANAASAASAISLVALNGASDSNFVNVTFTANSTYFGTATMRSNAGDGGVMNVSLRNVTFAKNNSNAEGGAIFNNGDDMTGAKVSTSLSNVIAWGDSFAAGGSEIYNATGATTSIDSSVIQDGCSTGSTCANLITADPLLSKLGNYGGFTPTLRPKAGSSAIDAGNRLTCPSTDQRGFSRGDGHCDIGAVEVQKPEDDIFADGFEDF